MEVGFAIIFGFIGFIAVCVILQNKSVNNKVANLENILGNEGFNTSKTFRFGIIYEFRVDFDNKKVAICKLVNPLEIDVINFSDIIECKIIEDSNVISKGGVGRALVGGVIAGGTGAIVGANTRKSKNIVNNYSVQIITNKIDNSLYNIDLINFQLDKINNADLYNQALNFSNNVYAIVQSIVAQNNDNKKQEVRESESYWEKIEKLSDLKDKGIITEQEFEEGKKKLLSKI